MNGWRDDLLTENVQKLADMASKVLTREEMGYQPTDRRRKPRFDKASALIAAELALEQFSRTHSFGPKYVPGVSFVVNELWARPLRYGGICGSSDGSPY